MSYFYCYTELYFIKFMYFMCLLNTLSCILLYICIVCRKRNSERSSPVSLKQNVRWLYKHYRLKRANAHWNYFVKSNSV